MGTVGSAPPKPPVKSWTVPVMPAPGVSVPSAQAWLLASPNTAIAATTRIVIFFLMSLPRCAIAPYVRFFESFLAYPCSAKNRNRKKRALLEILKTLGFSDKFTL
jgi:hypothetical protein